MNTFFKVRPLAAIVLYLCAGGAFAQQTEPATAAAPTPLPPAEAAQPAEIAPAPADAPAAPAETAPAAGSGAKRIVMLPVEFTVFQKSVAGIEAVPDWSETARFSLGQAATEMLKKDDRFQVVDVPTFQGETQGLLLEHVELFKVVGDSATTFIQYGGKPWADKKTNFDYTIGDGLAFLADASGADYAFLLTGAQVTQTGGAAFMQFLSAAAGYVAPGGGTYVFTGIVDLRSGNVKWLNARLGQQIFGMTGSDVRKPETAAEIVTRLFEGFPTSSVLAFPPF